MAVVLVLMLAGSAWAKADLKIALVLDTTIEEGWAASYIQAMDAVIAEKPQGLNVEYKYVENVSTGDGERVMKTFANMGGYDVLVFHSGSYKDAAMAVAKAYPDKLIVVNGSGFKAVGGNILHTDAWAHEAAYLMGIVAGKMTKTSTIGAVAAFPYANINLPVNAFFAGAKSVNPDIKQVVTYIESWFDPAKAKESAAAQISAGADMIFAERFGVFEAAREGGIYAFGNKKDEHNAAPDVVLSSAISSWGGTINKAVTIWKENKENGKGYNLPAETFVATMAEGGSAMAPYHNLESKVPQDVKDLVEKTRQEIMAGTLKVPAIFEKAESTR
jgi:basic membrane lipoprotein Med (substrate-binding protein (PBP1-ABC) superfamily)